MDDVLIRPASEDDLDAITGIYADAVLHGTASYEYDPPSRAEMGERFATLAAGRFPYLVAELGGRVAGYAYAGPFRTRAAYRFAVEDSIYIDPGFQGGGLGRALLSRLIPEAERRGYRQIIAVIGDGAVNIASVNLHRALGFQTCGRIEGSGFKHGRWLDTVLMQLALNGGVGSAPDLAGLPEAGRRPRGEKT